MTQSLAEQEVAIEQVLIQGDLSKLSSAEKSAYYMKVCGTLKLNPFTKPFGYLRFKDGGEQLYPLKNCTDQLRDIHKVSIVSLERQRDADMVTVIATGKLPDGRMDTALGAVPIKGLYGDALANAIMKAETKAKRRLTLAICGLGWTDESEIESIAGAQVIDGPALPAAPNGESHVPTREQDVEDVDLVRNADERIWKRYLELLDQAHGLGLNPPAVKLPIERDELKIRGSELVESIAERQEQRDKEEAARIAARAHEAAKSVDEMEVERQRREEGLI